MDEPVLGRGIAIASTTSKNFFITDNPIDDDVTLFSIVSVLTYLKNWANRSSNTNQCINSSQDNKWNTEKIAHGLEIWRIWVEDNRDL